MLTISKSTRRRQWRRERSVALSEAETINDLPLEFSNRILGKGQVSLSEIPVCLIDTLLSGYLTDPTPILQQALF